MTQFCINPRDIHNAIVYAIPSYRCNLSCKHCDQIVLASKYPEDNNAFMENLDALDKSNAVILFGGEPLLIQQSILEKLLKKDIVYTMSTNLLKINEWQIKLIKDNNILLGTSWDPNRFSENQHEIWKRNIQKLLDNNILIDTIFIALVQNISVEQTLKEIDMLDKLKVKRVQFQEIMPTTKDMHLYNDDFLFKIRTKWNKEWKISNITSYCYSCKMCYNTFTLHPNGQITRHCPHEDNIVYDKLEECISCKFQKECIRCKKQPTCSFFKKTWKSELLDNYIKYNLNLT